MADNTKLQYIVELLTQGDTTRAVNELNKLDAASDKAGKGLDGVTKGAKELFAFLGGAALVRESVAKFLEAERGVNALNYALEQTGNFTPKVRDEVLALADALGDELKVQADDVVKIMTQLVAFGANPRELRRLTEFVFDLSETMGRDTVRASRQLSQALRGNFEVFNALGIEVDKTKSATVGYYEALSKGEQIVSGRARASIQGVAGDVQGLTVTFDDAKQKLGEWTTAVLTATANVGANVGRLMEAVSVEEAVKRQKQQYIELADAIAQAILEAERLNKITKEEAGRLFGRLGGAREILHGELTRIGQTTSDEEMRAIAEQRLPQAGGLLRGLQQKLNLPGANPANPSKSEQANLGTPGLSEADIRQFYDELEKMDEAIFSSINEEFALRQKAEVEYRKMEDQSIEDFKNGEMLKQQLIDERLMLSLEGADREAAEIEIHHEERLRQIGETRFATKEQYDEVIELENARYEAEKKNHQQSKKFSEQLKVDMEQLAVSAAMNFSGGLSHALVSAFEEGDKAFQKFAQNFLRQMAEMILQALILKAISGIAGSFGAANGGQFANRMAGGGVAEVSSPTFLPKFNVLAGEAGREVLTVLSRPRFERVNGVPAQIGMANGQRLAITSADALERGGGGLGGVIQLRVTLSPEVKAELVNSSVKGARVMVISELGQDGAISRGVKGLAT